MTKKEAMEFVDSLKRTSMHYKGSVEVLNLKNVLILVKMLTVEKRSCENCKYYKHEQGKQRDNMTWETKECNIDMWNDAEFTQTEHICCDEWSSI